MRSRFAQASRFQVFGCYPGAGRLDGNGNCLPMCYFRGRKAAEAVARGHKQTYEVGKAS